MINKLFLLLLIIIVSLSFIVSCQQAPGEVNTPQSEPQADAEALFDDVNSIILPDTLNITSTRTITTTINGVDYGVIHVSGSSTFINVSTGKAFSINLTYTFDEFDYGGEYIIESGTLTLVQSGTVDATGAIRTISASNYSGTLQSTGQYNGSVGIEAVLNGNINTLTRIISTAGTLSVDIAGNTYTSPHNTTINY